MGGIVFFVRCNRCNRYTPGRRQAAGLRPKAGWGRCTAEGRVGQASVGQAARLRPKTGWGRRQWVRQQSSDRRPSGAGVSLRVVQAAGLRPKIGWGRRQWQGSSLKPGGAGISGSGGRAPAEDRVGQASVAGVSGSSGRTPTEGRVGQVSHFRDFEWVRRQGSGRRPSWAGVRPKVFF